MKFMEVLKIINPIIASAASFVVALAVLLMSFTIRDLRARIEVLESRQLQEVRFTLEDCPACKLRAEAEFIPEPVGDGECR